jgi:hypothetical protein
MGRQLGGRAHSAAAPTWCRDHAARSQPARRFDLRRRPLREGVALDADFRSFMTKRRAATVDFVYGKSRARSAGSNRTLPATRDHQRSRSARPLGPRRATYGLGLLWLKSYSSRIGFVLLALTARCPTGTDNPDCIAILSVHHHEKTASKRVARYEEAQLPPGMVRIVDNPGQGVAKGGGCLFETDAVPSEIRFRFPLVPRKMEFPEAIPLHKAPQGLVASATTTCTPRQSCCWALAACSARPCSGPAWRSCSVGARATGPTARSSRRRWL